LEFPPKNLASSLCRQSLARCLLDLSPVDLNQNIILNKDRKFLEVYLNLKQYSGINIIDPMFGTIQNPPNQQYVLNLHFYILSLVSI
jgi:hypothetical protein